MQRSLSDWGGNLVAFAIVILFSVATRRWARRWALRACRPAEPSSVRTYVSVPIPSQPAKKWPLTEGESGHIVLIVGRGEKIRTSDPHTPSVVRYQAAPRPDRVLELRPS